MASVGTHKIPRENKNESRWFKFFTMGQLVALMAQGVVDVGYFKLFSALGVPIVGIFIALMITIIVAIIVMGKMPYSKYQLAAGQPFYIILMRMVMHRIIHKHLYLRNYEGEHVKGGQKKNAITSFFN